eukprot:1058081-Rhodomonas_salina.1
MPEISVYHPSRRKVWGVGMLAAGGICLFRAALLRLQAQMIEDTPVQCLESAVRDLRESGQSVVPLVVVRTALWPSAESISVDQRATAVMWWRAVSGYSLGPAWGGGLATNDVQLAQQSRHVHFMLQSGIEYIPIELNGLECDPRNISRSGLLLANDARCSLLTCCMVPVTCTFLSFKAVRCSSTPSKMPSSLPSKSLPSGSLQSTDKARSRSSHPQSAPRYRRPSSFARRPTPSSAKPSSPSAILSKLQQSSRYGLKHAKADVDDHCTGVRNLCEHASRCSRISPPASPLLPPSVSLIIRFLSHSHTPSLAPSPPTLSSLLLHAPFPPSLLVLFLHGFVQRQGRQGMWMGWGLVVASILVLGASGWGSVQ